MPARDSTALRATITAIVLCACLLSLPARSASAATTSVLTICPALGTTPIVDSAGARECVTNDCSSIATAQTGSDAACTVEAPTMTLMSIAAARTDPAIADLPQNSSGVVAPAPAPRSSWQMITIRALVAIGLGALLLAGGLTLTTRRAPRPDRAPTARPAEAA